MFNESKAFSSFAVKDLQQAKDFYSRTLGLDVRELAEYGLLNIRAGETTVMVYPKPDHTPATYTVLNFPVDDIDRAVGELSRRGVRFEHYDGDIETDDTGVHRGDGPQIAWFKDPSGNILSVLQES